MQKYIFFLYLDHRIYKKGRKAVIHLFHTKGSDPFVCEVSEYRPRLEFAEGAGELVGAAGASAVALDSL